MTKPRSCKRMATKNKKKVVVKANQLKDLTKSSGQPITTSTHNRKHKNTKKTVLLTTVGLMLTSITLIGAVQLFSSPSTLNLSKNKMEITAPSSNLALNTVDSNLYLTNAVNRAVGKAVAFDLNNIDKSSDNDATATAHAHNAANTGKNDNKNNTANDDNKAAPQPQKLVKQLVATAAIQQLNNKQPGSTDRLQQQLDHDKKADAKKLAKTIFSQNNKPNIPITITISDGNANVTGKTGKGSKAKQLRTMATNNATQLIDEGDEQLASTKSAKKGQQTQTIAVNNAATAPASTEANNDNFNNGEKVPAAAKPKSSFFAKLFGLDTTTDPIEKDMKVFLRKSKQLRPEVLRLALKAYTNAQTQGIQPTRPIITIIDYSMASTAKRMWVLDLARKKVLFHSLVAHGRASGENYSTSFSDKVGSLQSSIGLFVTGDTYEGQHGYSLKIWGMDYGFNSKAEERAIVIHGAPYVNEKLAKIAGRIGRSWGCPAVEPQLAAPIIDAIKGGTIVFSYYPDNKWLRNSKFI